MSNTGSDVQALSESWNHDYRKYSTEKSKLIDSICNGLQSSTQELGGLFF